MLGNPQGMLLWAWISFFGMEEMESVRQCAYWMISLQKWCGNVSDYLLREDLIMFAIREVWIEEEGKDLL